MSTRCPSLSNYSLSISCSFKEKGMFMNNVAGSAHNSITQVLFLETHHHTSTISADMLYVFFPSHPIKYQKRNPLALRFNEIILTTSSRTFLRKMDFFLFNHKWIAIENTVTSNCWYIFVSPP